MSSFPSSDLRLTLLQADLAWQDAAANRRILEERIKKIKPETDLIILPEMFTSAFVVGEGAIAEDFPGPTLSWMQGLAIELDAAVTGSVAVMVDGRKLNRLLFVTPDGACRHYDKVHLFRMLGEDQRYAAGKQKLILQWRGWRICPIVCYDLRFPVFCRTTMAEPWDLLLCVANWPAARDQHWRTLLQARAIENLAWVAGVNRIGRDGNGLDYNGHSAVCNPQGEETLQAGIQEGVFTTTISAAGLANWRKDFPAWMDADPFEMK